MSIRVRYAPSPTGFHHIGGARTALFSYLLARSTGGTFILRIEDTDRRRYKPEYLADVYDTLAWLGLSWDEGPQVGGPYGPYIQSERVALHRTIAERMLVSGHAYRCYCDTQRLERVRAAGNGYDRQCRNLTDDDRVTYERRGDPSVVRFKVPLSGTTQLDDLILGSIQHANCDINPDPVLLKSDGFPTYHLAATSDDHEMRVSHVLRAQEWLSSAPLHLLIFQACGWQPPRYAHLPIVNGPDGKKLSKRHGAASVHDFRLQGYLPEALVNYIALLGWSQDGSKELFSICDLEKYFSIKKLHSSPATFDSEKLRWMNSTYIRALSITELGSRLEPYLSEAGASELLSVSSELADLLQERLTVLSEVVPKVRFLFDNPAAYAASDLVPKRLDPKQTAEVLTRALDLVDVACGTDEEAAGQAFRSAADDLSLKLGDLMMPIRVAITGSRVSPPLFGSMRILGSTASLDRVRAALAKLNGNDSEPERGE